MALRKKVRGQSPKTWSLCHRPNGLARRRGQNAAGKRRDWAIVRRKRGSAKFEIGRHNGVTGRRGRGRIGSYIMQESLGWFTRQFRIFGTFEGRATRSEYWYWTLWCVIATFAAAIVDALIGTASVVSGLFWLLVLVPTLAVSARRLHDIGKSGWWQLLYLLPVIGSLVLFVFFCLPSQEGANRFGGAAPKHP